MLITKGSGESVPFNAQKLKSSLKKAGANELIADVILQEIEDELYEGIPTKKIYKLAFNKLKENSSSFAARYHLKQAIMDLGPSGYPFEKFIAEIWIQLGFKVQTGKILKGKCINHEIDVLAENHHKVITIECKFHNQHGSMSDVKVPLYVHSRFLDIWAVMKQNPHFQHKKIEGWIITNTRFTKDAAQYGTCVGLHLLGWDFPENQGIKDLIDDLGLYPLTCLTTLSKSEKQMLLDKQIVLCKEIFYRPVLLQDLNMHENRTSKVLQEVELLCRELKK
ncbi:MAG: hypothetical protein OHK0038_12970 [Flammeovirgaceae bacterium]